MKEVLQVLKARVVPSVGVRNGLLGEVMLELALEKFKVNS
jgi:hypothetical protein